jgi:methionine synthase II (cobalamin-independent)
MTPKEEQKQHLIDMMSFDEKLGLYEDGSPGYNKQAELVKQLANKLKSESETLYSAEEVRQIAEWSFHFYKRNDLSDSELEEEWGRLLNERLRKK